MISSAPILRAMSAFSSLETTQTGTAPPLRAYWVAKPPRPPEAPQIRTLSPCFMSPPFLLTSWRYAVQLTRPGEAASSQVRCSGLGISWLALTSAIWASPPKLVSKPQIRCSGSSMVSLCPSGPSSSTERQCATTSVAGLPGVHAEPGREDDAGQVGADDVVGQVVALGQRGDPAVALQEAEGRQRLEDRGPHGVVVDRAGHHRDQRLAGAELGQGHVVDVQGLARVLLLGGHPLEHVHLVLVDHRGPVGLGKLEGGEVLRGGVAGEDGVEDVLHVRLLGWLYVRGGTSGVSRRLGGCYPSVCSECARCNRRLTGARAAQSSRAGRPFRRSRRWARRPWSTTSGSARTASSGIASSSRTCAPRQRGTAVTCRGRSSTRATAAATSSAAEQPAGERQCRFGVVELVVEHRRPDAVGADAADPDVADLGAPQVGLGAQAEPHHGVLGAGVHGLAGDGDQAGERGDVDHVPAAVVAHLPDRRDGAVHDATHVDVEHQLALLGGVGPRGAGEQHAGVVDPHREPAVRARRSPQPRLRRLPGPGRRARRRTPRCRSGPRSPGLPPGRRRSRARGGRGRRGPRRSGHPARARRR